MPVDLELWNKLNAFELDDPKAQFRFSDRLARENGWSKAFAKRAIDEYKKFVYLAAISETPVTPSDVVDQVWHLHLTFTRSYWNDMCANVLGHPLHHGPTKGGAREDAKYRSQYAETLALYRQEFGAEPPAELWPTPQARFASAPHQRWVDARTHFIIRKPKLAALSAGAALAAVGAAGAASAADGSTDESSATLVLVGGVAAALLLFAAAFPGKPRNAKQRRKDNGSGGDASFIATTGGTSGGKGKADGGEGGEGGEGGGDGGGGCGGGGCGS